MSTVSSPGEKLCVPAPAPRVTPLRVGGLLALATAAILLHGYHPYVEDAEIYLPGIKKLLNPALYQMNPGFFSSHAGMTMFPNLIAASVRLTHLPFDVALLLWQFASVFGLMLACWRIGRTVFRSAPAAWAGAGMVAGMLGIPIAGTALLLMDQYLNTRSVSTAMVLLMAASVVEGRYLQAALWAVATAAIHPLMAMFGITFSAVLWLLRTWPSLRLRRGVAFAALLPMGLFPPMSSTYHEALLSRSYFFLARWEWYELLGMIAPFGIFWAIARFARRRQMDELETLCRALNYFGLIFALASLLTIPRALERFTLLQPMRYLHVTYVVLFVLIGGLLAEFVLQRRAWRWLVLFVPICVGMFVAERAVFPASPHLELPGRTSPNRWVQAFVWIRDNTPVEAYFALNPRHMALPDEDQHGFRALAERSMLADDVKDSGAVTMFPKLAETWKAQTTAQAGWKNFAPADFTRLKQAYGIDWVLVDQPGVAAAMDCPYRANGLAVCRVH